MTNAGVYKCVCGIWKADQGSVLHKQEILVAIFAKNECKFARWVEVVGDEESR
jgi:hypothetical protein